MLHFFNFVSVNQNEKGEIVAPVTIVRLGEQIILLTIPGELFKIYEQRLYQNFPKKYFLLVGLCNGNLGYLMPENKIRENVQTEEIFNLNPQNGSYWYHIIEKASEQEPF